MADLTNLLKEEQDEEGKTTVFHLQYDEAVTRIACGPLHTIVLTNKSRIFTCGYGEKWNLGTGRNKTVNEFTEVRVKVNGKIDRIEAGMTSVGYLSAGRAYVVGTIGEKVYQLFTPVALNEDIF